MFEKWLKKKKILYAFGGFLALMLMCYLISRGIYAGSLPRVDTKKPRVMALAHTVNASGNVSQGSEEALFMPAGLPVQQVAVRVGDQVEMGDLLFTLDLESLEENIQERELEISGLELQISALAEQNKQTSLQRQETLERAQEDFEDTKETVDRNLQRVQADAAAARKDLTDHQNNRIRATGQEERDRQQAAYDSWCAQVKQAQGSYERLQEKEASLKKEITALEQEIAVIESKLQEMGGPTVSGNEADSQKEQLVARVSEKEAEWKDAKSATEEALKALEKLQDNPVVKPDFSAEDAALKAWEATKISLEKSVQSADRGVEDAKDSGEEALKNANRSLEDAKEQVSPDYIMEGAQMELAYKKEQLEKYQQLKEAGGEITARQGGIITRVDVVTGSLTTSQAAVVFAAKDSPYVFETVLNKEQKQYVNQGAKVTIKLADGRTLQAKVDYLNETAQGDGSYQAIVKLEQGVGNLGQSGTLETTFRTEQFACCIPLDALHSDANQRNFVYVLTETEGFLGMELSAKMMYVTVLDKNDAYAAIQPGVLDAETQLITYATKEFKDGTIVRMR